MSAVSGQAAWARRLPAIDGGGALAVGLLLVAFRTVVAPLYGLPLGLVTFIGAANVAYAVPGLSLTLLGARPAWLLALLVAANLTWTVVCGLLTVQLWRTAGALGLLHIVGEGVYVAALAVLEVRHRRAILNRQ